VEGGDVSRSSSRRTRLATVVHVRKDEWDIYVGRSMPGVAGAGWGNPFTRREHGDACLRLYLEWLEHDREGQAVAERARRDLRGKRLACWCSPRPCHGDVLAGLANGLNLDQIRRDVLGRVAEQRELFA
jgi:hypothetical protein